MFQDLIKRPHGILLVTGPTGSGKTTTLYAALQAIVSPEIKVLTVEDPVEYHLDGVNQIQVPPKIGMTFARGLRAILRHDPDVVMIGEIRDLETAEAAIQASLTGHLVLSTLHTNDACSAATRLLDMGVEPFLVTSTLAAAMAQRLVRTICPECKEEYEPDRSQLPADFKLPAGARLCPRRGLPQVPRHGLPRPDGHLRTDGGRRRHPRADHGPVGGGRCHPGGPEGRHAHAARGRMDQGPGRHHHARRGDAVDQGVTGARGGMPMPPLHRHACLRKGRRRRATRSGGEVAWEHFNISPERRPARPSAAAIQADSEGAVVRALDEKRLFPVRVKEQSAGGRRSAVGRVRPRDVGVLYGQLADLLRADVPVLRALEILTRSTTNRRLAALVAKVRDDVAAGRSLADSMAVHGQVFTPLHVAMVRAGERAGFLEDVLANLADLVERQDELQSKILGAMAYPVLLAVVGAVIITLVLGLLVPQFRPLFEGLPHIPAPTRVLFVLSDAVRTAWPVLLVAAVLAVGGGWAFLMSPYGRRAWDRWRLKIPLMGRALRLLAITRFCRVLGMMIKNGVPLLQALAISKDATGSICLAEGIEAAAENVRAGETLAEPLKASGFFPVEILEMIAVAEESNQLEKTLLGIADTVERRTNRQVDLVVRLIEPVILVVMATGIGFFGVALIYPIITMASAMK